MLEAHARHYPPGRLPARRSGAGTPPYSGMRHGGSDRHQPVAGCFYELAAGAPAVLTKRRAPITLDRVPVTFSLLRMPSNPRNNNLAEFIAPVEVDTDTFIWRYGIRRFEVPFEEPVRATIIECSLSSCFCRVGDGFRFLRSFYTPSFEPFKYRCANTSVRSICCLPTVKPALTVIWGDSGVSTI